MRDCAHDHETTGLDGERLAAALSEAEHRCTTAGERLTAPRRRVLELLLEAGQPVKAYDLMPGVGPGGETAKPPTVYRALEFLTRAGLAHRIESLNAYMACRMGEAAHAAGFLICDCCGSAREFQLATPKAVRDAARDGGYTLTRVTVEAHGLCASCAAA